jgi:hypothetical protein
MAAAGSNIATWGFGYLMAIFAFFDRPGLSTAVPLKTAVEMKTVETHFDQFKDCASLGTKLYKTDDA